MAMDKEALVVSVVRECRLPISSLESVNGGG